jgi:hypothetical protein
MKKGGVKYGEHESSLFTLTLLACPNLEVSISSVMVVIVLRTHVKILRQSMVLTVRVKSIVVDGIFWGRATLLSPSLSFVGVCC